MASKDARSPTQETAKGSRGSSYEGPRISKPDMFMAIALWMERSPYAQSLPPLPTGDQGVTIKKSGAVFVLPNDRALAVEYSQDGVHAAVSALNKFGQERAKGCQVYLSRRPCSFCAKLLVQCEVSKVYYLPIEPELDDADDFRRVDTMFMTASIGLSMKVPRIEEQVIEDHSHRESPYKDGNGQLTGAEGDFSDALFREYWNGNWIDRAMDVLNLPAFRDESLKVQIENDMKSLMNWIAHTTVKDVPSDIVFVELKSDNRPKDPNVPKETDEHNEAIVCDPGSAQNEGTGDETSQPTPVQHAEVLPSGSQGKRKESESKAVSTGDDKQWQAHALHMSRLAQMLSQRSDDPTRRVGCVLMEQDQVVAIGWNGFPAKALYGEFPRASDTEEERNKKEPYVIHAEQNALLTRNQNLHDKSSILFINEVPCDECVPLLIQAGVKKIVIPKLEGPEVQGDQISGPGDSKKAFKKALNKDFECFGSKRSPAVRKLKFEIKAE